MSKTYLFGWMAVLASTSLFCGGTAHDVDLQRSSESSRPVTAMVDTVAAKTHAEAEVEPEAFGSKSPASSAVDVMLTYETTVARETSAASEANPDGEAVPGLEHRVTAPSQDSAKLNDASADQRGNNPEANEASSHAESDEVASPPASAESSDDEPDQPESLVPSTRAPDSEAVPVAALASASNTPWAASEAGGGATAKPAPSKPAPLQLVDLAGRYRYVGGGSQQARREAAIERSAASVTFLFRGIAKSRLTDETEIWPSFDIAINGDNVAVTREGHTTRGVARPGVKTPNTRDGETFMASYDWSGSKLVERSSTKRGGRTITYRYDRSSDSLRVDVTLTSPHMDIPLHYALTYRRQ